MRLRALSKTKSDWLAQLRSSKRFGFSNYEGQYQALKWFSSNSAVVQDVVAESCKEKGTGKLREKLEERDLFLNVLSATTTKRDAKSYLSRFKTLNGRDKLSQLDKAHAADFHISLFKLRAPQTLSDDVIAGLAHTLFQLARLGLSSAVVLDCYSDEKPGAVRECSKLYYAQGHRLVSQLLKEAQGRAVYLDSIFSVFPWPESSRTSVPIRGRVEVQYGNVLRQVLRSGAIPIIPAIGHSTDTQQVLEVRPDDIVLALIRDFAHLNPSSSDNHESSSTDLVRDDSSTMHNQFQKVILDRLILLDPEGGIPSTKRLGHSHSFVNLEQEYHDIRKELSSWNLERGDNAQIEDIYSVQPQQHKQQTKLRRGVQNLDLLQRALSILPPSSSALLTTAWEAAISRTANESTAADFGVKTRRAKNPLIYNLLTDKPLVSSSLPNTRLGYFGDANASQSQPSSSSSTFIKRGMPLTIIPDPRVEPWKPNPPEGRYLNLSDSRIDFTRLLNLIEDSFGRPLDVQHYLNRIKNNLAGIIVAGEYEGGAILTWELPPGVPDDGSEQNRARMVPYLDKFAVLKRSQGAGGVADMVFNAMVLTCFPTGVCWRSRKDNPVNKWYFERSLGTLKLPDSQWTMFWTTEDLPSDQRKFLDYEGVCREVVPSWADKKHIVD